MTVEMWPGVKKMHKEFEVGVVRYEEDKSLMQVYVQGAHNGKPVSVYTDYRLGEKSLAAVENEIQAQLIAEYNFWIPGLDGALVDLFYALGHWNIRQKKSAGFIHRLSRLLKI